MINDIHNYEDIIDLPHHVSKKHPQMSMYDRAAQFSSFAALVGHSDAIAETARLTHSRVNLSDEEKEIIAYKIQRVIDSEQEKNVSILHFVPDDKKTGGKYIITKGIIKKYDDVQREIVLIDKTRINIDDIISVDYESTEL